MKYTTIMQAVKKILTRYLRPLQKMFVDKFLTKLMSIDRTCKSSPLVYRKYSNYKNVYGTQKLGLTFEVPPFNGQMSLGRYAI